jgi:hypothetical protein
MSQIRRRVIVLRQVIDSRTFEMSVLLATLVFTVAIYLKH